MIKIFRYELKKLLFNRFFAALMMVTLCYGYMLLRGSVILGIANTAPFSPWSFGFYLSSLLPMLAAILLFFIAHLSSKQEKMTQSLTSAAPVPPGLYRFVRCGAIFTGVFLMSAVCCLLGYIFLGSLFRLENIPVGEWLLPGLMVLVPALLFTAGLGMVVGMWRGWAVYGVIGVVLLSAFLPLPNWALLIPTAFFMDYPKTLGVLDPAFSIPSSMAAGRFVYCVLGILLMAGSLRLRTQTSLVKSKRLRQ